MQSENNIFNDEIMRREFGRRLKTLLELRGMTQNELSEETGISQVSISKYLNGKSDPSLLNVLKIARALDCSLDDLTYM